MSAEWPAIPPEPGTSVTIEKNGGRYTIHARDDCWHVKWSSGIESEIRSDGESFNVLITNGNSSREHEGVTWAEVGALHP
jgi:hypothetical protein